MALLCDALFPDPTTREFIREDGGRLEVVTDYDSMTATIVAKDAQFERMVQLLRNALVSTQLGADTVAKLRELRINDVKEKNSSPSQIADRAIAARLFGSFPYGHPANGAPETLARVERPDLMLARDRFLNADNSTLVMIGGMDKGRAMRALRQLIGQWRKGDALVPATFRPPGPVNPRVLLINQSGGANSEIRLAVFGLSRTDRDYFAAEILARILREHWQAGVSTASPVFAPVFVRNEAHSLPGMFLMGATVSATDAPKAISAAINAMQSLVTAAPSPAEFERVRDQALGEFNKQTAQDDLFATAMLDMATYNLPPLNAQTVALKSVSPADVQRVAARLFKGAQIASVAVGNSAELKASLGSATDSLGESPSRPAPSSNTPSPKP
jgi:zinc protease